MAVEQVRILEAVSKLLRVVWTSGQLDALVKAVFRYGRRWQHIEQKQLDGIVHGIAGLDHYQLQVRAQTFYFAI